jgi:hypothetical protein
MYQPIIIIAKKKIGTADSEMLHMYDCGSLGDTAEAQIGGTKHDLDVRGTHRDVDPKNPPRIGLVSSVSTSFYIRQMLINVCRWCFVSFFRANWRFIIIQ